MNQDKDPADRLEDEDVDSLSADGEDTGEYGEDDFIDEDWEGYDEEADYGGEKAVKQAQEAIVSQKKKSSAFNNIVIGVTVVIGIGIVLTQMGGGKPGQNKQALQQQLPQKETELPQQQAGAPDYSTRDIIYGRANASREGTAQGGKENQPKSGVLNDPGMVEKIESKTREAEFDDMYFYDEKSAGQSGAAPLPGGPQVVDGGAPPMPAPIAAARGAGAGTEQEPVKPSGAAADVLTPMPFEDQEPEQKQPAGERASLSGPADTAQDSDMPAAAPAQMQKAAALSPDAEDRLGKIFDRLDQIESRMTAGDEIARLTTLVENLEKKIDKLEEEREKAPSSSSSSAPASPKKAYKAPSSSSGARKTAEKSGAKSSNFQSVSSAWVLKGAMPGKAVVASAGSGETRSVSVGDTLTGIGRIQDISFDGTKWVVRGSKGSIVQ